MQEGDNTPQEEGAFRNNSAGLAAYAIALAQNGQKTPLASPLASTP
jgi:hypothetical protein